jgi:hypothetical protein
MSNETVKVMAVKGLLPNLEDLTHLKTDFKEYKEGKYLPTYFVLAEMVIFHAIAVLNFHSCVTCT